MTNEDFCKLDTSFYGEVVDNIKQIKLRSFDSEELKEYVEAAINYNQCSLQLKDYTKPPLCRVLRTGVGHLCKNCNSTMSRSGFLMLVGKRYCDNKKCPNSKPEKNYY